MLEALRDRTFVGDLIAREHVAAGKSIRQIEREMGLGKTVLGAWCRRHGIDVRGQAAASSKANSERPHASGEEHWRAQRPEASQRLSEIHRERMSGDANPVYDREAKRKRARTIARTYREQPNPHERLVLDLFEGAHPEPRFQHPVEAYIIDFAFVDELVALELDGRGHASRDAQDAERDRWLVDRGWTVVRVQQDSLRDARNRRAFRPGKLLRVLKELIPHLEVASPAPTSSGEYRVLVRDAQHAAGRSL